MISLRRYRKSHPTRVVMFGVLLGLLALQFAVVWQGHQKQEQARERLEAMPQISLQKLNEMGQAGQIKTVVSHDVRSGTLMYPQEKSYLEIINKDGKSFAWEKTKNSFMSEEFGKMMFSNSVKEPIVFKTGNVLVPNALSQFLGIGLIIIVILVVMVLGQTLVTEVIGGSSFKAQKPDLDTTLDDVIGYPEVKRQLRELKDQLLHPDKYEKRGVKPPRGILFTGDPGVGKTMMAKALANEIGADFFTATGADFAEMYVGVGPKRVRSLFRLARMSSVAVIFIDEIDALGSRNTMGNDSERLSTLNAMLAEMDGVNTNHRIVVIGATNHPDMLDPALRRPGRFDSTVFIPLPDAVTREGILRHYLDGDDTTRVDLRAMALRTQGYSGAQLKNIVLEARRLAVRDQGVEEDITVTQDLLHRAQEIALLGVNEVVSNGEDLLRVAVHELGHALSGYLLCPELYVEKVTVIGRGAAAGYAVSRPLEEKRLVTEPQMHARLVHFLAGRAAEEIVLGNISGGAADDIKKANDLARDMVLNYAMGPETGFSQPVNYTGGFEMTPEAKRDIQLILQRAYESAKNLLLEHKEWVKSTTERLMERGVLHHEELFANITRPPREKTEDQKWFDEVLVQTPPSSHYKR